MKHFEEEPEMIIQKGLWQDETIQDLINLLEPYKTVQREYHSMEDGHKTSSILLFLPRRAPAAHYKTRSQAFFCCFALNCS